MAICDCYVWSFRMSQKRYTFGLQAKSILSVNAMSEGGY